MLRQAHIYLPTERKLAVVVPVYQAQGGGFVCEQEICTTIEEWRDAEKLALALKAALKQFTAKHCDLRTRGKAADWPAFRASGCKTINEFESTYVCIVVRAFNSAELYYDAYAKPENERDVEIHVTLNPFNLDIETGRKLLKIFDSCQKWSEHNLWQL
jgi:hypothetical protein